MTITQVNGKKVGNTYVLGLELKTFDRKGSSKFRQLQNNDKYYFNYVYYRSFYEKSKYVDNPSDYPKLIQSMKDTIREKIFKYEQISKVSQTWHYN